MFERDAGKRPGRSRFGTAATTVSGVLLALVWVEPAMAYVDPGTGSMLVQLIGAAIVGAAFYMRDLRARIRVFFSGLFRRDESRASSEKE